MARTESSREAVPVTAEQLARWLHLDGAYLVSGDACPVAGSGVLVTNVTCTPRPKD